VARRIRRQVVAAAGLVAVEALLILMLLRS
jgi:hypothetical protein